MCFLNFTHLKWSQWLQHAVTLNYVRRISASILKLSLHFFFADLLFRPWYIPQDTCCVEGSFQRHQTHPYFPSCVMSGCKLAHFIVWALTAFDMPLTSTSPVGHSAAIQNWSQDIKMSLQYAVSRRLVKNHCTPWGVTPPLYESMTGESFSPGSHSSLWHWSISYSVIPYSVFYSFETTASQFTSTSGIVL